MNVGAMPSRIGADMGTPIDRRLEKLLEMSDRRGLLVEAVTVKGDEIRIVYAQPKARGKTADADLVDWGRK